MLSTREVDGLLRGLFAFMVAAPRPVLDNFVNPDVCYTADDLTMRQFLDNRSILAPVLIVAMFSTTTPITIARGCRTFLTDTKEFTDSQWWMSETHTWSAARSAGARRSSIHVTGCRLGVFERFEPRISKATRRRPGSFLLRDRTLSYSRFWHAIPLRVPRRRGARIP